MKKLTSSTNLTLSSKDLPEIKDFQVGGKCQIVLDVEVESLRKPQAYEVMSPTQTDIPKGVVLATFKIKGVEMEEDDDDSEDISDKGDPTEEYETEYADKRSSANK